MRTLRLSTFAACLGLLLTASAYGQATRTWVSGVGDDANPCSRTAPCKTFAGAISKTAAGGEISVLDPGGFGVVTITKSITISGDGTLAGILAAGTNGIIVNALSTDKVIIRNISINGAGTGINGIRFLAGGQLTVEHVTIDGFTTRGIDVSLAASGNMLVHDTRITRCATGVRIATTAGFAIATLDNVRLEGLTNGLDVATGSTFATLTRSEVASNTGSGVIASAGTAVVNVADTSFFSNTTAVNASVAGSLIRLTSNRLFNNSTGINAVGTVQSDGQNRSVGNTTAGAPNGGAITLQ
jgi:hypothetical protein